MWYLIDMDDGVVCAAEKKSELAFCWNCCRKLGKILGRPTYEVWQGEEHHYYLYSSREQADAAGFGFAVKVYEEGGVECGERSCAYCLYGYCSREKASAEGETCPGFPLG